MPPSLQAFRSSYNVFISDKDVLYDIIKQSIFYRRSNAPTAGEFLVIDAIMDLNDDDTDTMLSDAITVLIGGFHTSGQCKFIIINRKQKTISFVCQKGPGQNNG